MATTTVPCLSSYLSKTFCNTDFSLFINLLILFYYEKYTNLTLWISFLKACPVLSSWMLISTIWFHFSWTCCIVDRCMRLTSLVSSDFRSVSMLSIALPSWNFGQQTIMVVKLHYMAWDNKVLTCSLVDRGGGNGHPPPPANGYLPYYMYCFYASANDCALSQLFFLSFLLVTTEVGHVGGCYPYPYKCWKKKIGTSEEKENVSESPPPPPPPPPRLFQGCFLEKFGGNYCAFFLQCLVNYIINIPENENEWKSIHTNPNLEFGKLDHTGLMELWI